ATNKTLSTFQPLYSTGWDETAAQKRGLIELSWNTPSSWADAIVQGPHIGLSNPFAKQPNATLKNNLDWSPIDLESASNKFIPSTSYKPSGDPNTYNSSYYHWTYAGDAISDRSVF